jgi:hypothetical protein
MRKRRTPSSLDLADFALAQWLEKKEAPHTFSSATFTSPLGLYAPRSTGGEKNISPDRSLDDSLLLDSWLLGRGITPL